MNRALTYLSIVLLIPSLQACSALPLSNKTTDQTKVSTSLKTEPLDALSANNVSASQRLWQPYFPAQSKQWLQQILREHFDVQIADARLREAEALTSIASANRLPNAQLSATANRGNDRIGATRAIDLQKIGLNIDWDLDIAGAKRSAKQASQLRLAASQIAIQQVRIELAAALATALVDATTAHSQQQALKQRWDNQQTTIDLLTSLTQAGLQDGTQLEQALALQHQIGTRITTADASLANAQLRIERLLGYAPGSLRETWSSVLPQLSLAPLHAELAQITQQTSLVDLRDQPLLRIQRLTWQAQLADLQAAEAAIWPNLSIASFFGAQNLSGPVMVASNPIYALGATLSVSALDFGRLKAAARAADARAQQAALQYESLVIQTLENIARDLSDAQQAERAIEQSMQTVSHQRRTAELNTVRFQHGLTSGLAANLAVANVIEAELALIEQQRNRNLASLQCLVSMGLSPID